MAIRNYSATSVATTLAGSITNSATTFTVSLASGLPTAPFVVIVDRDLPTEEVMLVGTVVGTTFSSITRGYDSTSAVAHSAGATVEHGVSAIDFREANTHVNASTGVHGTTGAIADTSSTQTFTNKTLTSPTISAPAVSGGTITGASITGGTVNPTTLQQGGNTVATISGTETLTNKTLTSPTINAPVLAGTVSGTPTFSGATVYSAAVTLSAGGALSGTLTGSPVFSGSPSFTGTPSFTNTPTSPTNGPFAAWQAYTPTITNVTGGTVSCAFCIVGKTMYIRGRFLTAGTVTATGLISISMPAGTTINAPLYLEAGQTRTSMNAFANDSTNLIELAHSDGTNLVSGSSTVNIRWNGVVEIA